MPRAILKRPLSPVELIAKARMLMIYGGVREPDRLIDAILGAFRRFAVARIALKANFFPQCNKKFRFNLLFVKQNVVFCRKTTKISMFTLNFLLECNRAVGIFFSSVCRTSSFGGFWPDALSGLFYSRKRNRCRRALDQPSVIYQKNCIKKPRSCGVGSQINGSGRSRSIVAGHNTQDLQQADEAVEDGDVQADGGHDVVGLAAMNDLAGLPEDHARHQQDEHPDTASDSIGNIEQHRAQAGQERDQDADHQEPAHEAEILAADHRITGQRQENGAGAAQRGHHHLRAVGQLR
jgi:hypothetical protein